MAKKTRKQTKILPPLPKRPQAVRQGVPLVALVLAVVILAGGGAAVLGRWRRQAPPGPPPEVVARVGGRQIPRKAFEDKVAERLKKAGPHAVTGRRAAALAQLNDFITFEGMAQRARAAGLDVSEAEVQARQEEQVSQIIAQLRQRSKLEESLRRGGKTLTDLRAKILSDARFVTPADVLRQTLLIEKLQDQIVRQTTVSEADVRRRFSSVALTRVTIGRAVSPDREVLPPGDPETAAALDHRAEEILRVVRGGKSLREAAQEEPKSATTTRADDLPSGPLSSLDPEVARAVLTLQIGQLSEPVAVGDKRYIVVVTDRSEYLPPGYEQHKDAYFRQTLEAAREEALRTAQEEALAAGWRETEIFDPELQAYRGMETPDAVDVDALLARAATADPGNPALEYLQARRCMALAKSGGLLGRQRKWEAAYGLLVRACGRSPGTPVLHADLAQAASHLGRKQEALEHMIEASRLANTWDSDSLYCHMQAQEMFEKIGSQNLFDWEQQWITRWAAESRKRRGQAQ
jgi:hypothetical protein